MIARAADEEVRQFTVPGGEVGERTPVEDIEIRARGGPERGTKPAGRSDCACAVLRIEAFGHIEILFHYANDFADRNQDGGAAQAQAARPASRRAQVARSPKRMNDLRQMVARDAERSGDLIDGEEFVGVICGMDKHQQTIPGEACKPHSSLLT